MDTALFNFLSYPTVLTKIIKKTLIKKKSSVNNIIKLCILMLLSICIQLQSQELIISSGDDIVKLEVHKIDQSQKGVICGYLGIGEWIDLTKSYDDIAKTMSDPVMYSDNWAMCHVPGFSMKITKKNGSISEYAICLHCSNAYLHANGIRSTGYSFSRSGCRYLKSMYFDAFIAKSDLKEVLSK